MKNIRFPSILVFFSNENKFLLQVYVITITTTDLQYTNERRYKEFRKMNQEVLY